MEIEENTSGMYLFSRKEYDNFIKNFSESDLELLEIIFYYISLSNIPEFILKMNKIKILLFYGGKISFLTEEFCNIKSLMTVKFSSNIKYIPYNFGNLINLKIFCLHIEHTPIYIDFPLYKMKNLCFWENCYKDQIAFRNVKTKTICLFV